MNELILNENTISSLEVSEMLDKDHKQLLKDIRVIIEVLEREKISPTDYFMISNYKDSQNKLQPCYQVTKMGCEILGNKQTGHKGILFTAKYVKRFNDMQSGIVNQFQSLSPELQAIFILDKKQQEQQKEIKEVKEQFKEMPLFKCECDEVQKEVKKKGVEVLGGIDSKAYRNGSLRSKVYADIQKQLKREFGVVNYASIKRNQVPKAIEVIKEYKVPYVLEDLIKMDNDQLNFELN